MTSRQNFGTILESKLYHKRIEKSEIVDKKSCYPNHALTTYFKNIYFFIYTLILFYKQRFISNDFLTSLFSKKFKQQTRLFLKN